MLETIIGLSAGILGVSGFGYQIFKMLTSKETKAITYPMIAFIGTGVMMWAWYGISTNDEIIYTTNIIISSMLAGMAIYKWKHEKSLLFINKISGF